MVVLARCRPPSERERRIGDIVVPLPGHREQVLHRLGIKTVGQVAAITVPEIEALPGIGPKTLAELVRGMRRLGFSMRYVRR